GDRARLSTEGHPQAARREEEQDSQALNPSQVRMPFRKPAAKTLADQCQAQDEGRRTGEDLKVDSTMENTRGRCLSSADEIGVDKRRRKIVVVVGYDGGRDLEHQQAGHEDQNARQCRRPDLQHNATYVIRITRLTTNNSSAIARANPRRAAVFTSPRRQA